jgi:hypothetical protein
MKTEPYNPKLHKFLILKNYKYTEHIRYDRYDKGNVTIFYYLNGYIMILEGDEPARKELTKEIMEAI